MLVYQRVVNNTSNITNMYNHGCGTYVVLDLLRKKKIKKGHSTRLRNLRCVILDIPTSYETLDMYRYVCNYITYVYIYICIYIYMIIYANDIAYACSWLDVHPQKELKAIKWEPQLYHP